MDVELKPEDLTITSYPEPVPGGMHVGIPKGVRAVHTPTGIEVICTHHRSQHMNRDSCLRAISAAWNHRHSGGDGEAWRSIESAPGPGVVHVRGLWVRTQHEGHPDEWNFCTYTGWVGEFGDFVDTEHGETFGWELDDYEYWMPLPAPSTEEE